ncbi:MAG: carbon starvation protein A [Candidatus Omnitrophica bacterium]|nr:carbon starvation protein A [Candidatus Omnitrophota bacterium]
MNSLFIIIVVGLLFWWGIGCYARRLEKLWEIDPHRSPPAIAHYDSIDFVPAKNWVVLFGHHFASIAGAGPIIGPVLACILWGWGPAIIWIVLGTIFMGGVHDFGTLITSVREEGGSIAQICEKSISRRARILFSWFVLLSLVLVVAVFARLCAQTFVKEARIVLPSLGLIPVAILLGFLLYRTKLNSIFSTLFGLLLLAGLIIGGIFLPINLGRYGLVIWLSVLFIYTYFASILPVNILLQPRDYLSSFLLFFSLIAGLLGLLIKPISISAPIFVQWKSPEGSLWPMLCVTIACGAISGFHSLVSSGTTSKQLPNERYAKRVGYGAMVTEGVLATLALIAVTAVMSKGATLNIKDPIGIFAQGYGIITSSFMPGAGLFVAVFILNAFILTTLDSAARIARYLSRELFGIKNHYLNSLLVIAAAALLAFSGEVSRIWIMFGTANQLVAALALVTLVCWLFLHGKPTLIVIIPAMIMLLITFAALIGQGIRYFQERNILLFATVVLLFGLASVMIYEIARSGVLKRWQRNLSS